MQVPECRDFRAEKGSQDGDITTLGTKFAIFNYATKKFGGMVDVDFFEYTKGEKYRKGLKKIGGGEEIKFSLKSYRQTISTYISGKYKKNTTYRYDISFFFVSCGGKYLRDYGKD